MKPMIKRILCLALPVVMVMTMLTGCPPTHVKEFGCAELIAFYEEKGYSATHTEYPEPEEGCSCTVEIQEEDGKYIRFRFYDSESNAQEHAEARRLPWIIRIICSIFGIAPSRTVDSHWQAAYEYNSQTLYALFDQFTDTPPYVRESFFSQDYLENYHLTDVPVPKLENSRLIAPSFHGSEWHYFGNLTREEFDAYVLSVVDYLKSRTDIFYPSYCYNGSENSFTTFGETYDMSKDMHCFAFSMEEALDGSNLIDPIILEISWEENPWGVMDFSANSAIRIYNNYYRASYKPCAVDHCYDEGLVYPVPGMNWNITIRDCIYCDATTQSGSLDSDQSFAVSVAQGSEHILHYGWADTTTSNVDTLHAGLALEITIRRDEGKQMTLLVNGENIPVLREDENTQTFGFIMPESDVTIEIFPTETE